MSCSSGFPGSPDASGPSHTPFIFDPERMPQGLVVAVLAPHPDDFDAIAVSLRALHERGAVVQLAVLTSGVSGVEDAYPGAVSADHKRRIREREQRESCRLFGLEGDHVRFLRLAEDERGHQREDVQNRQCVRDYLLQHRPDLVFMPHGNDTNVAHQRTWSMFRDVARAERLKLWACLNRDAKTVSMRTDMLVPFGPERAEWKSQLLRAHDSQQARNLRTRGHGFDERVLALNRSIALEHGLPEPFAEAFELVRPDT